METDRECYSDPSSVVQAAVRDSMALTEWMRANHTEQVPGDVRTRLCVALNTIAIDHREAIILLISHGARSSGHALARSMLEAHIRAAWVQHCAQDAELERAWDDGVTPKIETMVSRLNKVPDTLNAFGNAKRILWAPFSEFTHGGMVQVSRWIGADEIAQGHADAECVKLLRTIDIFGLLSFMAARTCIGASTEGAAAKAQEAVNRLREFAASMGGSHITRP